MRVVFTPLAERHLDRLFSYIADKSSERIAEAYIGRIVQFCRSLGDFPIRGRKRDDILQGLRTVGFERRVTIAFMVMQEELLIEGVFYGGQLIEDKFN